MKAKINGWATVACILTTFIPPYGWMTATLIACAALNLGIFLACNNVDNT